MHILRFSSTQFRNLEHEPLAFFPHVNLFVGENGHGKTNVLEAIYFFKFGRSFRTQRDNDLIRFDEPFCRVEVESEYSNGEEGTFAMSIERSGGKRIKIDGDDVRKLAELVGRYPSVLFGPQDLGLMSGFAAERRRFLDMTGSMTDRSYLDAVRAYKRVLTQRNAILKAGGPASARRAWDEELVTKGCALIDKRVRLVDSIRDHLAPHVEAISVPYTIAIAYESELTSDLPEGVSPEESFVARLAAVEADETRRHTTLVGPHRDDLRVVAGGRDLRRYGSQGQRRLFVILLRLAELTFLESELREPCVLLLDDLFSELDHEVSEKLKRLLEGERQIFVTSPIETDWGAGDAVKMFRVSDGRVE